MGLVAGGGAASQAALLSLSVLWGLAVRSARTKRRGGAVGGGRVRGGGGGGRVSGGRESCWAAGYLGGWGGRWGGVDEGGGAGPSARRSGVLGGRVRREGAVGSGSQAWGGGAQAGRIDIWFWAVPAGGGGGGGGVGLRVGRVGVGPVWGGGGDEVAGLGVVFPLAFFFGLWLRLLWYGGGGPGGRGAWGTRRSGMGIVSSFLVRCVALRMLRGAGGASGVCGEEGG